jgi:diguanylate cyclase (GGDEF)-like protein
VNVESPGLLFNPTDPLCPQSHAEDSFLDLLTVTLGNLDRPVRGQFLQKFFNSMAQVELTESFSLECWDQILSRRLELAGSLSRPISLSAAIVDVLAGTKFLRVPILMEYGELKKLQINAATDALTGLYNRRLFDEYFSKELDRAKRYRQQLAVLILDMHRFKEVNDRFGHLVGDQALQTAATTLRKTLRTSDYAFRIGGDEFALLLPQSDPEHATALGRRIRANYESATLPLKLDKSLVIDYGVSVFPDDGDQKEVLLRLADERLYQLKHATRNPAPSSRVVRLETAAVRPPAPLGMAAIPDSLRIPAVPASAPMGAAAVPGSTRPMSETRKWERVALFGARAYVVLVDETDKTARVVDLSYGGVALLADSGTELPLTFQAVLHLPILPPVKVSLRRVNESRLAEGEPRLRVGCALVRS